MNDNDNEMLRQMISAIIKQRADGERFSEFYKAYLKSPRWKAKSEQCIQRAGYRCERCKRLRGDKVTLQAHHKTYERLGRELPEDLECVCTDCHKKADRERRIWAAKMRSNFYRLRRKQ